MPSTSTLKRIIGELERDIDDMRALRQVLLEESGPMCDFAAGSRVCRDPPVPFEDRTLCKTHIQLVLKARLDGAAD